MYLQQNLLSQGHSGLLLYFNCNKNILVYGIENS